MTTTQNIFRQAITTKFLPPTYVKGARIKASCERGSITLSWSRGDGRDNHTAAMRALLAKFRKEDGRDDNGWGNGDEWWGGATDKGDLIAWVYVPALVAAAKEEANA